MFQVLRGFLERNVSKRLGAKKTTMFDIGGATAVKHHPFFEGIDWAKLLALQVEPPLKPELASTTDTSNFAEEFVGMALPRSLSHESLLSHGGNLEAPSVDEVGEMFRGFSFVADSFIEERDWQDGQDQGFRFIQGEGSGSREGAAGADGVVKKVKGKRVRKKGKGKKVEGAVTTEVNGAPATAAQTADPRPAEKSAPVFVREPVEELKPKPSTLAAMLKAQQKDGKLSTPNSGPSKPRQNVWGVSELPAPAPVPTPVTQGLDRRSTPERKLPGHRQGNGAFVWKRPV